MNETMDRVTAYVLDACGVRFDAPHNQFSLNVNGCLIRYIW